MEAKSTKRKTRRAKQGVVVPKSTPYAVLVYGYGLPWRVYRHAEGSAFVRAFEDDEGNAALLDVLQLTYGADLDEVTDHHANVYYIGFVWRARGDITHAIPRVHDADVDRLRAMAAAVSDGKFMRGEPQWYLLTKRH